MQNADSYYFTLLISLLVLLCFSAFFSACEMAFSTANRIKLKGLAEKSRRARLVLRMLETYDKILSTVLIGNNFVNIFSSSLATALFIGLFGPRGVTYATLVMTILLMILCDISPKALAKETPEKTAMVAAPLLRFFVFILTPVNFLTSAWQKFLLKLFPAKADRSTTEDELLTFVGEVRQEGGINHHEEKLIRQVFEFDELTAAEICIPRMDIAAVPVDASISRINAKFAETGYSRLPVYRDSIDKIEGLILLKDFHHEVVNNNKAPSTVLKPVVFVTKTIKIPRLLQTMQKRQTHFAVVVDEFGGTLGIVTIEDIIEELVGEIWDEHDEVEEAIVKGEDGSYRVRGNLSLPDMFEFIKAAEGSAHEDGGTEHNPAEDTTSETPDSDENQIVAIPNISVGSWALEKLGGLPKAGDRFVGLGLQLTVTKVHRHRVLEALAAIHKPD